MRNNQKETWVWTITSGKGFGKDVADVVVYMGYKMTTGQEANNDVWRQQIEWREAPGAVALMWALIRDNLKSVLTIIASLLTIGILWLKLRAERIKQNRRP